MRACQTSGNLRSPHSYPEDASEDDSQNVLHEADCEGIVDCIKKSVTSPPANQHIWQAWKISLQSMDRDTIV